MVSKMNTGTKGVLLVVGAYIATTVIAVLIIVISFIFVIDAHSCSAMGRALLALGGTLAGVFIVSLVVVGITAWKIIPNTAGRLITVAVHGVSLLVTYVGFVFGMLVAFNC